MKCQKEIKEIEKKISEINKPKQLHTYNTREGAKFGILTQNIMDFESLCYSLYKADGGVKVSELKKMNCIEFYTHEKNLREYLKRQKNNERRD